jgi:hypothetical protein
MEWDVSMSTRRLPDMIRGYFRERADFLFKDILSSRYKGGLTDLPYTTTWDRQRARVTFEKNPLWYSKVYWENTPHWMGKKGPRRTTDYDTFKRNRFTKAISFVAHSKDRYLLRYDTLARKAVLDTLMDGVDVEDGDFGSLIERIAFELDIEPVNEVRRFFGEDDVMTYRDKLNEFRKDYGDDGEAMFFNQYEEDLAI